MSWATSTLPKWPSRSPSVAAHSSATARAAASRAAASVGRVGREVGGPERRHRVAAGDRGALADAARVEADDVEAVADLGADLEPARHPSHAGRAGSARVHDAACRSAGPGGRPGSSPGPGRGSDRWGPGSSPAPRRCAHSSPPPQPLPRRPAPAPAGATVVVVVGGVGRPPRCVAVVVDGDAVGRRAGPRPRFGARRRREQRARARTTADRARSHRIHARRGAMAHDLTFGVFVPQGWKMELASIEDPQAKWAKAVEVAKLAEELGLDSLWVYDHFHNVPVPPTRRCSSAGRRWRRSASVTSRIKLGQMVGCAPYRNPVAAGEDHLEHRRDVRRPAHLGHRRRLVRARVQGLRLRRSSKASDRIRVLRETVEIVKAMWTEPDVSYDGKHFQLDGAQCDPKPLQQPHPQILIGGGGEQLTLRVVARLADASNFGGKPHEFKHKTEVLQRHCKDVGRDYDEIQKTMSRRDLHPRDRGRGRGRRHAVVLGRAGRVVDARATSSARPSRSPRRSRPTSTSAAPASTRGAATTPTPRRCGCSPRRSCPQLSAERRHS